MTEKLYDLDYYLQSFSGLVVDSFVREGKNLIVLDKTCFFPEGGGQPSDIGFIGPALVTHVYEENGVIFHEADRILEKNKVFQCQIDFDRRFLNMQIHTGEHILSGTVYSLYNIKNIGFHMGSDFNTVDFDRELSADMVAAVQLEANKAVWKNETVKSFFPNDSELSALALRKRPTNTTEPIKVIVAGTADICACCGTHTSQTGEVGIIKIVKHEKYKGGSRLFFLCGSQALADYDLKNEIIKSAGSFLSLPCEKLMSGIIKLKNECDDKKALLDAMIQKALEKRTEELIENRETIGNFRVVFSVESEFPLKDLVNVASKIVNSGVDCVFLGIPEEKSYKYILAVSEDSKLDARIYSKEINSKFSGKGGGRSLLVQGSFDGEHYENILRTITSSLNTLSEQIFD